MRALTGGPILIVVARADEREPLALALRFAGHRVIEARSADEARAHASSLRPTLLVLDERFAALGQAWKRALAPARLPVVLLVEAIRDHLRADDLLTKPVDVGALLVRVRGHLYRSEAAPGGAGWAQRGA
ncbi:MAG TPA: hypothetical protein VKN99_20395 [Polyangia bacterium]|nr:hypothetical protein [Polyangia bacterium]